MTMFSALPTTKHKSGSCFHNGGYKHESYVLPVLQNGSQHFTTLASSTANRGDNNVLVFRANSRKILSDRKGAFDHLNTNTLIKSSIRVSVMQASQIFATYLTDQMEAEQERDDLLSQGKITLTEFEEENKKWETHQWALRWNNFHIKAVHAILRFQAVTLIMRLYEKICEKNLCLSDHTLDKLTKDPFKSAIRKRNRLENDNSSYDKGEMMKQMFKTCLWANAISFLSDFTVQQTVVLYGFYKFRKRKRRLKNLYELQNKDEGENNCVVNYADDSNVNEIGGMMFSFFMKSASLSVSRTIGLLGASAGGAIGSAIYPGWGTLFGTQIGDSAAGSICG